jgi:hypothetical protein
VDFVGGGNASLVSTSAIVFFENGYFFALIKN